MYPTSTSEKYVSFERDSAKRGLHVQNLSQGCLFFSALPFGISNICKVSMEGSVVPVSMSMLLSGPSTKDIYETVEIPVFYLRKLMVRLLIFLEGILIMAASIGEVTLDRDSLISLHKV